MAYFGELIVQMIDLSIRNLGKDTNFLTEFQVVIVIYPPDTSENLVFCNLTLDLISSSEVSSKKRMITQSNLCANGETEYRFTFYHKNFNQKSIQSGPLYKIVSTAIVEAN